MRIKAFIVTFCLLQIESLEGQPCLSRDSLWNRLIFLRDSSTVSAAEKLKELLTYEIAIKSCSYQNDSTHALLLQRIGAVYFYQADFIKAARYMQGAVDIISANTGKPSVNPMHNIRNYFNLSWISDSLNNVKEKMKALDSCAALAMRLRSVDIYGIRALHARTEYSFDIGDYDRCINYATMCEKISREYAKGKTGNEYMVGLQFALISLFWKVNALIKFSQFDLAEELLADKIEECKKAGLKGYLGTVYQEMAEVQLLKGNYEKALSHYKLAFKYEMEEGDNISCKVILNNIGYNIYYKKLNDINRGLAFCKNALTYINRDKSDSLSDDFESLKVLGSIANLYAKKGFYDSAFHFFQLGLNKIRPGISETSILHISDEEFAKQKKLHYLVELLINKGDAFIQKYKVTKKVQCLDDAVSIFKATDRLLDRIKLYQTELQSKLLWRSDSRRMYESAIEACFLQGNKSDAFYFFEKSRAVLLNDKLNEQYWKSEGDILEQTQLKKRILQLESELNREVAPSGSFEAKRNELFTSKQDLERLEQTIKANNPLYYQSFLDTGFINLLQVQKDLLKEHQGFLEIFSGDSAVYTLLVTPDNCYFFRIHKQDFELTASRYLDYLSDAGRLNRDFEGFTRTSSNLFKLMFQDMPLPNGRIIISPAGQYFPFESLIVGYRGNNPVYFLEDHAVSYTYSARFLMNDFRISPGKKGGNFLGFAPVKYPPVFSLATLPGSDYSLKKISRNFDNAVSKTAAHASRNNFLQLFSGYRVIQLYTHAADSSINNEPVIYLADSALYLSDLIYGYKPITRLVVLSACETGAGKVYQGEGVFSFNRGFAALGIPAAITNLWVVDNASTYDLTELFYKWLAKGLPTDVALQKAKLEFLSNASKEKSMPCYWAGPVLVGKTDNITLNRPYPWKRIVLFLVIGGVVFLAVRQWITSRKIM